MIIEYHLCISIHSSKFSYYRFLVLVDKTLRIYYNEKDYEKKRKEAVLEMNVKGCQINEFENGEFEIIHHEDTGEDEEVYLRANNGQERQGWIQALTF